MFVILSNILSLTQYISITQENPQLLRPEFCPACGRTGLWCHAHYLRKPDRSPTGELNPVLIFRFLCRFCGKTCSVLPECIPPRRWYLWEIQQLILYQLLLGASVRAASRSQNNRPSRSTCRRWWAWLLAQFLTQRDALLVRFPELGRTAETVKQFWPACLAKITLARAMYFCHQAGVPIP